MRKIETLGQFEQLVLSAVKIIENAYAPVIHPAVEQMYARPVKIASIYATLDRLEEKGYVSTRLADPDSKRANLPKRYYTITETGDRALKDSAETAVRFLEALRSKECGTAGETS